jgi:hypothetical protein
MEVAMTTSAPTRRPSVAARRAGYLVGAVVNAMLLLAVNFWPGWQVLPFLTADTTQVLGLVNLTLWVGLLTNLVYLARDPRPLRALGELVTMVVGGLSLIRTWQVFPFDFGDVSFNWALVVRIVLLVGIVGTAIGIVAQLVSLLLREPTVERSDAR